MKSSLPYPPGTAVLVAKLSACPNPVVGPGSWDNWIPGGNDNEGSLPVDYWLEGILLAPVLVGGQIHVFRLSRNGVEADGGFESTPIVEIREPSLVETFNSVYRVSAIERGGEEK